MKKMKKILALVLAAAMTLAMSTAALAADLSTPEITINAASTSAEGQTDITEYTWYRIFEADIAEDPTQSGAAQSEGKVAYFTDSPDKKGVIDALELFTLGQVGTTSKWYVELTNEKTSAEAIATALAGLSETQLNMFPHGTFAQERVGGMAKSGTVAPGYYYIVSTAGMNAVIQTLTKVEIDEKNAFPPVTKTVDKTDENAQIGDEINYTLTVEVPASANDKIELEDTMTNGLTFKAIDEVKAGSDDVDYTLTPESVGNAKKFTITFDKNTVIANREKTITIKYTAILNEKAKVGTPEENKVVLKYGNKYTSKTKTTETKTYHFYFDKIDGTTSGLKLPGAEFELQVDGKAVALIEEEAGKLYRIAMPDEQGAVTKIVTNGNTIRIYGLDTDVSYVLHETKAPTGYNEALEDLPVAPGEGYAYGQVENNKGTVLPSTGGMGTTLFYVLGAVLVLGAGVVLVTRRRMD